MWDVKQMNFFSSVHMSSILYGAMVSVGSLWSILVGLKSLCGPPTSPLTCPVIKLLTSELELLLGCAYPKELLSNDCHVLELRLEIVMLWNLGHHRR
jgi:hypothetical protein